MILIIPYRLEVPENDEDRTKPHLRFLSGGTPVQPDLILHEEGDYTFKVVHYRYGPAGGIYHITFLPQVIVAALAKREIPMEFDIRNQNR